MIQDPSSVAPPRIGDGSREFLFAWVFFGAGLFAAFAAAWGARTAGPFSSLCLVIGFIFMAAGFGKRLMFLMEQRLIDIETRLRPAASPPTKAAAEASAPEPPALHPAPSSAPQPRPEPADLSAGV